MNEKTIHIHDVTLRDGAQSALVDPTARQKINAARLIDDLADTVELGFPAAIPADTAVIEACSRMPLTHARACAFGMTRRADRTAEEDSRLQQTLASPAPIIALVGVSSRAHVEIGLRLTPAVNLSIIADSVRAGKAAGKAMVFDAEHVFDGYAADSGYTLETLHAAAESGVDRIALCDTRGARAPREIATAVEAIRMAFPKLPIDIHPHNDRGLALANAIAALEAGADGAQGTIGGIGERCGNLDLLELLGNLALDSRFRVDAPLEALRAGSEGVAATLGLPLRPGAPFVGNTAYAHKAGLHHSALRRNVTLYEHAAPERFGNERRIVLSRASGQASLDIFAQDHELALTEPERARVIHALETGALIVPFDAEGSARARVLRCARQALDAVAISSIQLEGAPLGGTFHCRAMLKISGTRSQGKAEAGSAALAVARALLAAASRWPVRLDALAVEGRDGRQRARITASVGGSSLRFEGAAENEGAAVAAAITDVLLLAAQHTATEA